MSAVSRQREWQLRNPVKARAHAVTQRGLANGELLRPATCSRCPNPNPQAHHDDYEKPLEVTWLCFSCHVAHHRDMRAPEIQARREAQERQRQVESEERRIERRQNRTLADVAEIGAWNHRKYTEDDLLDALRDLAVDGYISRKMYATRRTPAHPSPSMYDLRFASWVDAVTAAGLKSGARIRQYTRMSDETLVAGVRLVIDAHDWLPSIADYDTFRDARPELGLACSSLLRQRLGAWADCLRLAGADERQAA